MRIMKGKSQDPTYHVIQDVKRNGKRSTEIIENLGNASTIRAKYGIEDVDAWADEYIRKLRAENSEKDHKVLIPFNTTQMIKSARKPIDSGFGALFLLFHRQRRDYTIIMI